MALGCSQPQSAPVLLSPGINGLAPSHPVYVMHGVFHCMGLPGMGHSTLDLGHHLFSSHLGARSSHPPRNCMAQPGSFRPPHPRKAFCTGTKTSLNQCTTTGCPKRHPDLREVGHSGTSHTRSFSSVAKPCRRPGRCHCVPGCHPCQAHPCSTHKQLSSLQGCRDDGVSCRSRGSQVNLSIHQGPHFLPSTLGDN